MSDVFGYQAALDDTPREAPVFYGTYGAIVVVGAAVVLIPGAPLIPILVLTQVLNAILLLPLLCLVYGIVRDPQVMGEYALGLAGKVATLATIVLIAACVVAMAVVSLT